METSFFPLSIKQNSRNQDVLALKFTSISFQNVLFDTFLIYEVIERNFSFARPEAWLRFEFKFR